MGTRLPHADSRRRHRVSSEVQRSPQITGSIARLPSTTSPLPGMTSQPRPAEESEAACYLKQAGGCGQSRHDAPAGSGLSLSTRDLALPLPEQHAAGDVPGAGRRRPPAHGSVRYWRPRRWPIWRDLSSPEAVILLRHSVVGPGVQSADSALEATSCLVVAWQHLIPRSAGRGFAV